MIKLAFFLVKYLFSNKYRVIIAFSSKIDYLCFRVIQLCEVWGIRLIDFRNQFVTHPFLSLILQFVNQRDSLNGNNRYFIASFFAGRLPLCNKYDLVDLQYQVRQRNGRHLPPPSRQFPQLAVCEELVAFYSDLSHNLDEGLNCLHFHRLKQEELCILLRGYYSLEDLYILLKSVIGSSDNFKDFVLENYQHVNDVSDFALLAHMSVRNFQRKFKEEFKWPVREWLNERRAERILRDIRNTDKSIAEIATSYGFATASYFTVFCKQYFGMTPSELRRRSKQTATKCRE